MWYWKWWLVLESGPTCTYFILYIVTNIESHLYYILLFVRWKFPTRSQYLFFIYDCICMYICVFYYVCIYVREWACVYAHRLADKRILNLSHVYSGCQTTRDFGLLVIIRLIKYSCFLFFLGRYFVIFQREKILTPVNVHSVRAVISAF